MEGVFVTAVDTGVGKTVVSAGLLQLLHGRKKQAAYWKPVQTGTIVGDDTSEVKKITGFADNYFIEPAFRFPEPISPHMAARKWGKKIEVSNLVATAHGQKAVDFLIVEGAGGLLVPLNEKELQFEFIKKLGFPVLLLAEDRVGAINQTLLSLDYGRDEGLNILGVIITKSRGMFGNSESIASFGKVEILLELPPSEDNRLTAAQVARSSRLGQLFNVNPPTV